MKRKILSVFLCSVMVSAVVSGCGTDTATTDTSPSSSTVEETTEAATAQVTEAEYKTMEPPEDGWTIEELMSVTYICGKQLTYPLTMEYLGKDFLLDESQKSETTKSYGYHLLYRENEVALVYVPKESVASKEYRIDTIIFNEVFMDDVNCISINGMKFGTDRNDVEKLLGNSFEKVSEKRYECYDSINKIKCLDIVFKENKVAALEIYIK